MNILVINGSPKKVSDTMALTNAFIDGLKSTGDHDIETVNVIEHDIKPCLGCFMCWRNMDGKCVRNDYQNEILAKITRADIVVWSFPLYCYGMPSHLKAVIDRTIPLAKMTMREENGVVKHDTLIDFSKKRYVVICGCGFPDWEGNFDPVKQQCRNMFGDIPFIAVPETPMMNEPSAAPLTAPLKAKFVEAGKEFGSTLTLSSETVKSLETPMLPNEVYIQIVNGR